MAVPKVNEGDCVSCGACEGACPAGAISIDGVAKIDAGKCKECGECVSTCPVGAISAE